jgi:hypothetical protein
VGGDAYRVARSLLLVVVSVLGASHAAAGRACAQEATRSFYMGFTPFAPVFSDLGRSVAYGYLGAHADIVSHTLQDGVPWNEALASSDWRTYPRSVLDRWGELRTNDATFIPGHARYVSIHPIASSYDGLAEYWGDAPLQPLPAPWNARGFDHPDVKTAFLNYAIATVEFFQPTYLGLGVEANILLARRPWLWAAYKELNTYVYTELKARYPGLTVFVTIQYEHMLGILNDSRVLADALHDTYPTVLTSEVRDVMRHSDLLALSTYPYMAVDAWLSANYFDEAVTIGAETGRRLAVDQSGYTSVPVQVYYTLLQGDESTQNTFVALLLWTAYVHEFAFVINFLGVDYGLNYGDGPVSLTWAYTGLFRPDGTAKPAATTWTAFRSLPLRP